MGLRRILYVSKLLLISLLLYTIFQTAASLGNIDSVLAPSSAKAGIRPIQCEIEPTPKLSIDDFAQIIKKDPFGNSNDPAGFRKSTLPSNPVLFDRSFAQQLGLTLMGTITGSRSVARAIIKNSETNKPDFYKIGQFVGDARIESIKDDAVVLVHYGQNKILPITSWASLARVQSRPLANLTDNKAKSKALTTNITAPKSPKTRNRKKIESAQEILAKTTIKPYIVEGRKEGLEISGLENMTFAKIIGLKNGDVISAVNGHRITSKQRAYQILKKARHRKAMSLDLIRDDRQKNISFAL